MYGVKAIQLKIAVILDVVLCSLMDDYGRFGGSHYPHLQDYLKMVAMSS
jgi:hypothetical protein